LHGHECAYRMFRCTSPSAHRHMMSGELHAVRLRNHPGPIKHMPWLYTLPRRHLRFLPRHSPLARPPRCRNPAVLLKSLRHLVPFYSAKSADSGPVGPDITVKFTPMADLSLNPTLNGGASVGVAHPHLSLAMKRLKILPKPSEPLDSAATAGLCLASWTSLQARKPIPPSIKRTASTNRHYTALPPRHPITTLSSQ